MTFAASSDSLRPCSRGAGSSSAERWAGSMTSAAPRPAHACATGASIAGVIADRSDRKQIMMWCNFGRAAVVALIPIAALVPGLGADFAHLLLITLVFSAVGQLFGPAEAAVIPTILPRSALITANSMALLTMVLTLVVGGALAPILSRIDLYAPYWLGAALLAGARALVFPSRIPKVRPAHS